MSEEKYNIDEYPIEEKLEEVMKLNQEQVKIIEDLQQKADQLENIRKEVIEYIKDNACYSEGHCKCSFSQIALDNLLNILNKGE